MSSKVRINASSSLVKADSTAAIPVEDKSVPGSHKIFDFANFDTRYVSKTKTLTGSDTIGQML